MIPLHLCFSGSVCVCACVTFGNQCVLACSSQRAIDLADQLHVVKQGVEGVEVGEADHVTPCSLGEETQRRGRLI